MELATMIVCAYIFTFCSFIFQESPEEGRVGGGLLQGRGTECSGAGTGPFEGGHQHAHYLHHRLASGQTTGREHSPAHQQKIGFKIY